MHIRNSILVSFWLTFTFADVIPSRFFKHEANLDGSIPNGTTLFQAEVSTELECASACFKMDACAAYSTTPVDPYSKAMTCWLHRLKFTYLALMLAAMGSKTYTKQSSWLERPCTTDSDCPAGVANVVCFATALKCLCQPGFYYSHSLDDCVQDCATEDLQPTFLRYPGYGIPYFNFVSLYGIRKFEVCGEHCLVDTRCRTIDFYPIQRKCRLQAVTPLSPTTTFKADSEKELYQRTCR